MNEGISMGQPKVYNGIYTGGLNNLLEADAKAREYYLNLPKEKRDMIFAMEKDINNFEALKSAAELEI